MNQTIVNEMNALTADAMVIYQKLHHYHWNVSGNRFFRLHEKFEELYNQWTLTMDELAERVLTVGGRPVRTLAEVLELTHITEDNDLPEASTMVSRLIDDFNLFNKEAAVVIETAEEAGDRGTVNLLDAVRDQIEKDVWMLKAWLDEMG